MVHFVSLNLENKKNFPYCKNSGLTQIVAGIIMEMCVKLQRKVVLNSKKCIMMSEVLFKRINTKTVSKVQAENFGFSVSIAPC